MADRLISADALEQSLDALMQANGLDNYMLHAFSADDFIRLIDGTPTVDAVEVVRCKNCEEFTPGKYSGGTCARTGRYRATTGGFCLHGIRKEGGRNGAV